MIIYHPRKHWKKQVKAIEEEGEKQKEPIYKQWEKQLGTPNQNIKKVMMVSLLLIGMRVEMTKDFKTKKIFEGIYDRKIGRTDKVNRQINFNNLMHK